ncbi:uncharacterized protein LOC132273544 [Cornus florida]|uniref:uncharacterized protein LOC132273544 n=1 Tax=Cornus florida TaxID=4283 RepID=UPI0028A0445E|nr:uncharacterized protein LOC132273544 [Cornus florida]
MSINPGIALCWPTPPSNPLLMEIQPRKLYLTLFKTIFMIEKFGNIRWGPMMENSYCRAVALIFITSLSIIFIAATTSTTIIVVVVVVIIIVIVFGGESLLMKVIITVNGLLTVMRSEGLI